MRENVICTAVTELRKYMIRETILCPTIAFTFSVFVEELRKFVSCCEERNI